MRIVEVPAAAVRPMRSAVLRPKQAAADLVYPGDELPGAVHAAAFDGDGDGDAGAGIVGIVSLSPEPHPVVPRDGDWRIRGMATDPSVRSRGTGRALLDFVLAHARARGGQRVWCNARTSAIGFYERFGMRTEGAEFRYGDNVPHFLMAGPLVADPPPGAGPLSGLLVVDLTRALAGPHATMMLGDLGARVIKVEAPGNGDDSRSWGPPFVGPAEDRQSTYFLSSNRDKESIVLDLKDPADGASLTELLRRADVLCENFRPGVLTRLGFSDEQLLELNPRLVVMSISGFGHDGPEGGRAGYDQIAQGEAGFMSLTGSGPDDPQKSGVPVGDLIAGMWGAYGVLAALLERERTGRGQIVRTSLLAGLVGVHAFQGTRWTIAGEVPRAQGNHHPSISPYGLFRCRDGAVQLACGSEGLWTRLCAEFGLDRDAPGMATNPERVVNRDAVIGMLETSFADVGAADLLARLDQAGVPGGKVRTLDEVYNWEQTRSQGLAIRVEHPTLGPITLPGSPLRFFADTGAGVAETTRSEHAPPPLLDEDGTAIRSWLAT